MTDEAKPVHPGKILTEEFLVPRAVTKKQLAIAIGVPVSRINRIANGRRSISTDSAVRLARYFGNSPEFWLNLQSYYDLRQVMRLSA